MNDTGTNPNSFYYNRRKIPWVYIQEETRQETPKANAFQVKAEPVMKRTTKTNQYGHFHYSEMQYGRIEEILASALEIGKSPMRIRNEKENGFIFNKQPSIVLVLLFGYEIDIVNRQVLGFISNIRRCRYGIFE